MLDLYQNFKLAATPFTRKLRLMLRMSQVSGSALFTPTVTNRG